ncbi:hypothetical protein R1flu_023815 [Riccia fluitans]|uniref:Uncharacterized protein n=1 Tax=Riccia fluitans TaxID=41844 RepID=A0ABD1XTY5_9MARC
MAPRSSKNLKTKEVKIPHLTVVNQKKMESWGLGGLFVVDWSGTYDNLLWRSWLPSRRQLVPSLNTGGSRRNGPRKFGGRLFEAFHVEIGSVTTEVVAWNMKEMFAPPPVVETNLHPWKEMATLLTEEQRRTKAVVEQCDYFEGKNRCSKKTPEIAMWCAQ